MTEATIDRVRKSVKLTTDEYRSFVKWVGNQQTKVDAALIIGISRTALDRIMIVKSGSKDSIDKILKVLRQDAGTDNNVADKKTA